jgi:hypothetical protein
LSVKTEWSRLVGLHSSWSFWTQVRSLLWPSPMFVVGRQLRQIGEALIGHEVLHGDDWDEVIVELTRDALGGYLSSVAIRVIGAKAEPVMLTPPPAILAAARRLAKERRGPGGKWHTYSVTYRRGDLPLPSRWGG